MTFKRNWDASCPREWDRWEADGTTYVIQDLPPEDDDTALEILVGHMLTDEVLCKSIGLEYELESVQGMSEVWMECLKQRMSLACYAEKDGQRKLVALNVCLPKEKGEKSIKLKGKKWQTVYGAVEYVESKARSLETLGLDLALTALGLVVLREYRGAKLGAKVLAAREPLCRHLGIKGTTTIFTGIASQKLATKVGFTSIAEVSIKELAASGLDYPADDEKVLKMMIKRYE